MVEAQIIRIVDREMSSSQRRRKVWIGAGLDEQLGFVGANTYTRATIVWVADVCSLIEFSYDRFFQKILLCFPAIRWEPKELGELLTFFPPVPAPDGSPSTKCTNKILTSILLTRVSYRSAFP